jgi:acyl transferase domain-containing protein/acyl carrier protein
LFPTEDGQAAHDRLAATAFAQPALFSVEYALARTLIRWGVVPDAMCGHSIGEYVAACIAEVFSLEDALRLVVERGRLMQEMEPGVMMAVPLAERALRGRLNGGLSLAAVNAPSLCVVSGTMAAAATLERACAAEGIACRTLHTSHAFHSAMMDPVLDRFLDVVRRVDLRPPRIPYISNLTGTWVTAEQATDPAYWAKQLRQTVRFDDGVRELARRPSRICVEVGPGRALTTLASTHLKKAEGQIALSTIRHPSDTQEDLPFLLKSVGALWTAGANIDWPQFYSGQARNRVPLPTYPFERKRFWVDPVRCDTRAAEPAGKPPVPRREMEDWFYVPVWKPTPIPQRAPAAIQDCLIFSDGSDLARAVAQDLRRNGVRVATVGYALACPATGEPSYTIDPADPAAYAKLLAGIDRPPRHIIHFWSCSDGTQPESLSRGMYSLVHLAQALGRSASTTPLTIDVVTNGVLSVAPGEETRAEKATLLGPVRVIPQEYEGVQCRLIDLGPPSAKVPLEILMAELESTPKDSLVAYRGRTRWVQMFEPSPLPRVEGAKPLRPRGTYLITGGTGGIGLVIARYLARAVEARLVLITRSQFPARSEWKPWLESHSPEDAMSTKIATILEIEEEGGSVLVLTADVSDRVQLAEAIAKATAEAGPIHGIFHCAGVPGGGAIQQRSIPQIEATLAPKLAGTLNLESIFEGTPIDFLVICSSLTSIQGGFGQMDYCAANAFLDAFAEQRARQGQSVSAINWGAWEKVGMAANAILPAGLRDLVVQTSGPAIPPEQGADALARAMVAGLSRVAIVPYDFRATRPGHLSANEKLARPAQARPELGNDHVAPRDDIERQIAEIWQELLGVEGIGVFDSFLELGGHSLLATQLMSRVRARCGIALPMAAVFEDPTIAGLASRVTALRVGAQLAGAPLGLLEAFEEEGEV